MAERFLIYRESEEFSDLLALRRVWCQVRVRLVCVTKIASGRGWSSWRLKLKKCGFRFCLAFIVKGNDTFCYLYYRHGIICNFFLFFFFFYFTSFY